MVERERLLLPDAELSRPALVLAQRFVRRWDLHARQLDDGSYVCVHEPLNVGHLLDHLRGETTLGTYLLDQESLARFIVLDADDEQGWERLGHLASMLADQDVPAYLERSRRDGHLWLFLAQAVAGREARAFGLGLLAAEDSAFRIFNCGLRTISRDLQALSEQGVTVPLRSQQRDIERAWPNTQIRSRPASSKLAQRYARS